MNGLFDIDWQQTFVPSHSLLEMVLRGTLMYLATFLLLRVFRRQTGSIGPADLLVLLLIADAASNGMSGEYRSVTEGLVLVATIIGWEYAIDWLSFRSPWFQGLVERSPLLLVSRGELNRSHLEGELMTVDELMAQLRRKGIDDVAQVRACFLEGDGHISVLTWAPPDSPPRDDSNGAVPH